ncbi:MAG TPA: IS1595 family transposase [Vicinamibacterales bacterium]|nr:IS1595 family transposase [Vicinamibacterales bacterium]
METPFNLATLAKEYSDENAARLKFEEMRWGKGCKDVTCPHCGVVGQPNSYRVTVGAGSSTRPGLWRCRSCKGQFTVTKGTVFEDSHVPLTKWLLALYLLAASKKGMSAHQIHRMLKVKYQTAWFMMHRLRYAMGTGPLADKLRGVVEMDETYLGGKRKGGKGRVPSDKRKAMVVALVERDGRARAFPMPRIDSENAQWMIRKHVDPFAAGLMTDDAAHYSQPQFGKFRHETIKHSRGEYVKGSTHTNSVEGFFSLLKRGIVGTFHHIGTEHLDKYANEFAFRYSHRGVNDGERAELIFKNGEGKRLTYKAAADSGTATA